MKCGYADRSYFILSGCELEVRSFFLLWFILNTYAAPEKKS
jgi:hypothetical protein